MQAHHEYVAGWLDSSVRDFLGSFPRRSRTTAHALVTCLDSNTAPASLLESSPELQSLGADVQVLGKHLLLSTESLLKCSDRLFFGFDEVWFFPNPPTDPKPDSAWIVGPGRIAPDTLAALEEWMSRNGCSLALGDGAGMNFIVKAQGLVRHLLGHSMNQTKPAAISSRESMVGS